MRIFNFAFCVLGIYTSHHKAFDDVMVVSWAFYETSSLPGSCWSSGEALASPRLNRAAPAPLSIFDLSIPLSDPEFDLAQEFGIYMTGLEA